MSIGQRLTVNGVELALSRWGDPDKPPMLLLHGWGDVGASFEFIADFLATDFFVVAPTLRGFGDSEWSADGYWFANYLADVDAVADALFQQRPFGLVGHSMGGNVAGLYAGVRAERISHLVLLEGFGMPPSEPDQAPGRYRRWLEEVKQPALLRDFASFDAVCAHLARLAPRAPVDMLARIARWWAAPVADGKWRLKMDPVHKRVNPILYRREEAAACWRQTTAAVLLVAARESDFAARFPRFDVLANTASFYPNAREAWVEEAGHMLHWEQPQKVADLIRDFVSLSK